jgi:hypothetical protein
LLAAYTQEKDYESWASCRERGLGARGVLKIDGFGGVHEFGVEGVKRVVTGLTPTASLG